MSMSQVHVWSGLNQFPLATQTALHASLRKLRQENINNLTVLVLGRGCGGKSSTVNSIIGERVAAVSAFQSETLRPLLCSRTWAGFTLNIIDTPSLVEGLFVDDNVLETIKRFLLNKTIDVMIYVDRLDGYRIDNLDKQIVKAIGQAFGPQIWRIGLISLTHAQISPPDGLSYAEFTIRRSLALQELVYKVAGFRKDDPEIPVALVENSSRCATNDGGEKILPDGTVWLPKLVEQIVGVCRNSDKKSIVIDQKLIEGSDGNQKGKVLIPFLLILQYFFVLKPLQKLITRDTEKEFRNFPRWEKLTNEAFMKRRR